jgi:putative transposase
MARPLRIAVAGGLYHLITRGNAREHIYLDDLDREIFLDRLAHSVERYGWLCHAYCLMDNHYHLLVETPQPNLSIGMRQLNGLYAQTFNSRHDRCGHVFQARFRSIFVEKDSHLLSCCRYLVLNPVRAGVCEHPEQYRWSSYRATAGTAGREEFLTTDWLLRLFAPTRKLAQHGYSAFVGAGIPEARDQAVRGERLGGEQFLRNRFGYDPPIPEIPRQQIEPLPPPLEEIFAAHPTPVAVAYRRHGYALREIADHLGCHYSTISRRLRAEEAAVRRRKT